MGEGEGRERGEGRGRGEWIEAGYRREKRGGGCRREKGEGRGGERRGERERRRLERRGERKRGGRGGDGDTPKVIGVCGRRVTNCYWERFRFSSFF